MLRWRQNAQVLAPDELREEAESRLGAAPRPPRQRLRAGRDRRPAAARGAAPRPLQRPRRGGDPARALRPPGHPRRDADRSGESGRAAAGRRAAPAARTDRRGAAARTSTCSTSSTSAAAPTSSTPKSIGDEIEVDSEPYGDNFARPARLLPLEAKALVAAIDLFGDHLPQGGLQSARDEDRQGARPRPLRGGAGDRLRRRRRRRGRARRQRGDRRPAGCSSSSTTRRTRTSSPSARSSPTGWRTGARAGTSSATT